MFVSQRRDQDLAGVSLEHWHHLLADPHRWLTGAQEVVAANTQQRRAIACTLRQHLAHTWAIGIFERLPQPHRWDLRDPFDRPVAIALLKLAQLRDGVDTSPLQSPSLFFIDLVA